MQSTVMARGQTAIPAAIRRRYNINPKTRLDWIDDGRSITVVPLLPDPVRSLRGKYSKSGLSTSLSKYRKEERSHG